MPTGLPTTTTEGMTSQKPPSDLLPSLNPNIAFQFSCRTCVAIAGSDYCVIAADTRMSTGYSILTREYSKICKLWAFSLSFNPFFSFLFIKPTCPSLWFLTMSVFLSDFDFSAFDDWCMLVVLVMRDCGLVIELKKEEKGSCGLI